MRAESSVLFAESNRIESRGIARRPVHSEVPGALGFSIEDIPWEQTNSDGTRSATIVGTRDASVAFSYAFFIPAGIWDQPHSHSAAVHLVVASGELHLGYGDQFDPEAASPYPAGSFLYVPAGVIHFDGGREDTVLLGTAVGPWSTDYA